MSNKFKSKLSFKLTSFGLIRLSSLLLITLVLILDYDSNKLVNGQLEAVGAVLSVVPVTSILATAGLVGVKLAALSRLLNVLGYDHAYLANGGAGTAAEPIGLQTNYAYMFPYVPGLNISVRGDHSSQYQNQASQQKDAGYSTTRKTFPAMGLPGDYESQNRPFRGSETLREIFKNSGIELRLPTSQQQQQFYNNFPAQGNGQKHENENVSPHFETNNNNQQTASASASTPIYRDNNNLQPTNPTPLNNNNNPPSVSNLLAPLSSSGSLMSIPAAVNVMESPPPPPPPAADQQLTDNRPSSSSFPAAQAQPGPQQQSAPVASQASQSQGQPQSAPQQVSTSSSQQQQHHQHQHGQPQNSQVNMPHPSNIRPPKPQPKPKPLLSPLPFPLDSQAQSESSSDLLVPKSGRQRPLHTVPQHDYFYNKYKEQQRKQADLQSPQRQEQQATLPSGQLVKVPPAPLSKPPSNFEDYLRNIFGPSASTVPAANFAGAGAADAGSVPYDISTNLIPLPSVTDGPPPFHDEMDQNEFNLVNRRRKRDLNAKLNLDTRPKTSSSLTNMIMSSSSSPPSSFSAKEPTSANRDSFNLGMSSDSLRQPTQSANTMPERINENFGMPALNIYPSFRKKRSLRDKILEASVLLKD